ncbi:hypothetical protein F4809DRAFT_654960 [Biscogniauxia mediterranea]|nr:hypothetical protein F4809DRAFT_654960 [Biscogniauxia mediterranea]
MQKNQEMSGHHQLHMSNSKLEISETQILDLATASSPPVPLDAIIQQAGSDPTAESWRPHPICTGLGTGARANPIRVVDLTAFAIGLIPNEVACGVSGVLGVAAALSAPAVTYNGSRKCLKLMNEHYFHPRKLHVKIAHRKRIVKMFGLDKNDHLMWACELSFDVLEPSAQTTMLARMAAWQVKRKTDGADESAQKSRKRAWKKHHKGKTPKEGWGERLRIKFLDWILVQNLDEWEAAKAEKQAKKGGKENKKEDLDDD